MSNHPGADHTPSNQTLKSAVHLPPLPIRTTSTFHELTTTAEGITLLYGPKLLRMECAAILKNLAKVEEYVISLKDTTPVEVAQASQTLHYAGCLLARAYYDDSHNALLAFTSSSSILPPNSEPRAIFELVKAKVSALAEHVSLHQSVMISKEALRLLEQLPEKTVDCEIFQAKALLAIQAAKLKSDNHGDLIACFSQATEAFLRLSDPYKLSLLKELNDLTVALFAYFPLSQREKRQSILRQIHEATSSSDLYQSAPPREKFQLDLNLWLMATYSPAFKLTLTNSNPQLRTGLDRLGEYVKESFSHPLDTPAPSHNPLFSDMLRVAKLCRDHGLYELAYTVADRLYTSHELTRIQHRDILLHAAAVRLTSRPHMHETSSRLPSPRELKDRARRDFSGDRDAIDQIELMYGELLLLLGVETFDQDHVAQQRNKIEEIAERKGVKDSVRLRAIGLLEELYSDL